MRNTIIIFETSNRTDRLEPAFDIDLHTIGTLPEEIQEKILKRIDKSYSECRLSEAEALSKAKYLKEIIEPLGAVTMRFRNRRLRYTPLKCAYPEVTWL
ncbi:hypothetical protein ACK2MR_07005 [Providencia hangzhouensis]|uniref:hypothetical protein n=1 Tax=Providencia TaxID=586 RepID=UPI00234A0C26|nr:hypothetical protein [Providencia sp. PROV141]